MWPFSKREERRSIDSVPWGRGDQWGAGGPGPESFSVERAIRCVPAFGAVRFLADNIAAMAPGLGLYKIVKDEADGSGIAERQPTPSLFANPSIHGTLFDWLHKAVISMGFHGDGIGLVTQRDYLGFPTMIEWLNPINVQTMDLAIEGPGSYVDPRWYWWGRPMDPRDLLHIPWFCMPWRVRGLSPIGAYAATMGINLGAQEFANEWFRNGGVPPGTFQNLTQKVLPDDADEISRRITGHIRKHQPLTYGMDWKYEPIAVSPNEAKFLETMQASASNIAVIYGVPPEKIGGSVGDSLTYSTVEQNTMDCLTFTFRPWLVRYEYAFSTCFPRGQFVRFDTAEFLRVDAKTRAQIDALSLGTVQTGWKKADEVRASYNLPPGFVPTPPPAPEGNGVPQKSAPQNGRPTGGTPTPGTSSAAAEPITRSMMRDRVNGHNGHDTAAAVLR
jgi:HK97 family phage portal protein